WINDATITTVVRRYLLSTVAAAETYTILLDNFPGSAIQARLLHHIVTQIAPTCLIHAVELMVEPTALMSRAASRRVCDQCERDPLHDPRLPAVANPIDPGRCARCNGILQARKGDSPSLLKIRMQRYNQAAVGIRNMFRQLGVGVMQL